MVQMTTVPNEKKTKQTKKKKNINVTINGERLVIQQQKICKGLCCWSGV